MIKPSSSIAIKVSPTRRREKTIENEWL